MVKIKEVIFWGVWLGLLLILVDPLGII